MTNSKKCIMNDSKIESRLITNEHKIASLVMPTKENIKEKKKKRFKLTKNVPSAKFINNFAGNALTKSELEELELAQKKLNQLQR